MDKFNKRMSILVLASLFAVFIAADFACACSCGRALGAFSGSSAAVFSGRVVDIRNGPIEGFYSVEFMVNQSWEGVYSRTVTVLTAMNEAGCGYGFVKGKSYLVYADGKDQYLRVSLCSETQELEYAQYELNLLGNNTLPLNEREPKTQMTPNWIFLGAILIIAVIATTLIYKRFRK